MHRPVLLLALLHITAATSAHADWLNEPVRIRGAFLSWGPSERVAADLQKAGLTEPCYYFNACYERASENPDDFRIQWKAEPQRIAEGWAKLCLEHNLNLLTCINSWSGDEGPMFEGKNYRHLVTVNGRESGIPCPTDLHYWDVIARQIELIADLGPGIKACLIDVETYNAGPVYPGYGAQKYNECYCNHCFGRYLGARSLDMPLPAPEARFPGLVKQRRADDYERFMEEEMVAVGRQLGDRVRARRADLIVGVLNFFGWHSRGLVRGLAEHGDPVMIWGERTYWSGYSPSWREHVHELKGLAKRVIVVGGLGLSGWGPKGLALQGARLSTHADGYWLFCANSLFATRKQQEEAKSVWRLKALYAGRYYEALRKLNHASLGQQPSTAGREVWSGNLLENLAEGEPVRTDGGFTWPAFAGEELLVNGGFEEELGKPDNSDTPGHWRRYYASPQRVGEGPRSGQYCCRLENNNAERPCSISQYFPAKPGQSYRFSGYFRTDHLVSGQGLHPKLSGAAAGRWRGHYPEWTRFEVTSTCPPDAEIMALGIEMHYTYGTAWLDDLSVTLSPRRTLLTQPFTLPSGHSWSSVKWEADVPESAKLTVDLLNPETACPLALDVANGERLELLSHVVALPALQLRVTVEPDGTGRYPKLDALRLATTPSL